MFLIGIIEDDVQLRKTMENYISVQKNLSLVFSCNRIEKWISTRQDAGIIPDCILLDIGLPGISGLDAISIISSYYPGVKILVITGMEDPLVAWQAMMNGANGFLLKPFRLAEMQKQLIIMQSGGTVLEPEIMSGLIQTARNRFNAAGGLERFKEFALTQREIQVAELLIAGSSYKEISSILNVSYTTVNEHIKNIYKKVKVNSKMAFINKVSGKK